MKRGKDEGKIMGPMFPRLHVNDTEKGGPRAPPRNKMALYEQFSIPSQKFSHTILPHNRNVAVPYSSQGGGNERGVFSSRHQPPRLMFEKQYSQYSDLSSPLTRIQPRKKLDEDDFAVPIFTNFRPSQVNDREKATPINPSYFNHSLEFSKAAKNGVFGHLPQESVVGQNQFVKAVSNSSIVEKTEEALKQTYPSSHEPGNSHCNRNNLPEPAEAQPASGIHSAISRKCTSALTKSKCSISSIAIWSEDQNILHDVANDGESREDGPCRLLQMGNLDRSESVSETLVVDAIFGLDITPDDVVGIIGQRHFWKARRTITNQQRAFACQVFELHRLIKVQKGMALSRHLLQDVSSSEKPIEPVPSKNLQLDNPSVALPNVSKGESVKPSHKNKLLVQHSVGIPSISAAQTSGNSQATSISSQYTPPGLGALNQTQPHGHQWLIPLMSPSEGLVYKPYPGNGYVYSVYGGYNAPSGSNPGTGCFSTPTFGIPLQHPTFPSPVPQAYFPPYSMPIMSTAFSGLSVEQTNVPSMPHQQTTRETNSTIQHDANMDASEDIEVQCSSSTFPIERLQGSGGMKSKHMLPLFPLSPTPTIDAAPTSSSQHPKPEHPPAQVIKVVPHHSESASESAARIFQSIQEERWRYDSSL
ncbi:protein HEADING DATE 3B-like [Primulina tabacum]|uniref:protein HEADING DATE 3B-like n=1 Tax=Primulina tabacum TaxID=48773 RepID=UPI003F5929F9